MLTVGVGGKEAIQHKVQLKQTSCTMLLFLLITIALQLTVASGFLDNCPIDKQRINKDAIVGVLQTFYTDLLKLGGITELLPVSIKYTDEYRAKGMRLLEDINNFNIRVDGRYGIKKSPNMALLPEVHASRRDSVTPWGQIRKKGLNMKAQRAKYPSDDDEEERLGPRSSVFARAALFVDKVHVVDILCESVQKLQIMGIIRTGEPGESSKRPVTAIWALSKLLYGNRAQVEDYSDIIAQSKSLGPDFAKQLDKTVVKNIEKDAAKALKNVEQMCKEEPPNEGYDFTETFARWFRAEIRRLSPDRCDENTLYMIDQDISTIVHIRYSREGVGLGRIFELEAKFLLQKIECFHGTLEQVS